MLSDANYDMLKAERVKGETSVYYLPQIDRFICSEETENYIHISVPSYQDAKHLMNCYCKTELEGKILSGKERANLDLILSEHTQWREDFSKRMQDLMIDIETIGKTPGSIFVSIGAVYFDMETGLTGKKFYTNVDIQSAINAGLVLDADTLLWWMKQDEDARLKAFGLNAGAAKPIPINTALNDLRGFVRESACVWGNGSVFDCTLLEVGYNKIGQSTPWQFWNVRDVRTFVDLAERLGTTCWKRALGGGQYTASHDPVEDCIGQINYVVRYFQDLKEGVHLNAKL